MSSLLATSGISKARPPLIMSRMSFAFASASALAVRAWASWVLSSDRCCALIGALFAPTNSPLLPRNSSTFASASATRWRSASMLMPSQLEALRAVSFFAPSWRSR